MSDVMTDGINIDVEFKKMCYFGEDEKWHFTNDDSEVPCLSYVFMLVFDSNKRKWCCGYAPEDEDAQMIFVSLGDTIEQALMALKDNIEQDEAYRVYPL